ncbi:hypothetical protein AB0C76_32905 [Kitasatospora sp. NPDC048722]|uniref:hypothetical protein n=1 Tax=Kitasatospora sp. NPDC048722 TaxID=3155639 RepID=UPI0033EAE81B
MIPIFPLLSRVPRLRNLLIPLLFFLCLGTMPAHAANIAPVGLGDLMPSPSTSVPPGGTTLFETYNNMLLWQLDSDLGVSDVLDSTLEAFADLVMMLIVVVGRAVVVIVQWLFALTSIPELEKAVTRSIGGAATGLAETLLPTALGFGMFIAFVDQKKSGNSLSQIAWVAVSGIVSISLLTSPGTWVSGVDTARTLGAGITMQATSAGLGDGTQDFPFKLNHAPQFTGNVRDDALRKSSDSVWRAYVVTPWCLAEFGSMEVCRKFGTQVLDKGTDADKRKEWLQDNVTRDAVGKDSVSWRQGHRPAQRLAVLIPCLISLLIFAVLVIMLCFTSLASLLGALMLLLTGVVFACLWVIPGRPRRWGLAWFDQLVGRVLESMIATLVLGAVLSLQTASTQMFGTYGWLPSSGLSIAVAVVGIKFRSTVATIFGVSSSGGSAIGGILAMRALSKVGRRTFKPPQSSTPPRKDPGGKGGGGSGSGGSSGTVGGSDSGSGRSGGGLPPTPTRPRPIPPPPPPPQEAAAAEPGPAYEWGTRTGSDHRTSPRPLPRPQPQPRPVPAGTGAGTARTPLPAGSATTSRPEIGSSDKPAAAIPETRRPELPPVRTTPPTTAQTPRTGQQRAAQPDAPGPEYGFRQAPPPAAPGEPRVIRGEVISRTPPVVADRPRRRSGATTPPPARKVAPAARMQGPTPRATRRG